jgi:surface carbohydrate biosynthesis protein
VSGDRRPVLFLPVEVKVREFRAKLLVAGLAARAGFRVYVGSKTAIRNAMVSRPDRKGVFFGKGGDRFPVLDEVKRHCEWLVVQDEEIGPGMTVPEVERSLRSRFGEDVAALVDEVYLFSDSNLRTLEGVRPGLAARAVVTGWPRVDLWHERLRGPDEAIAQRLRARHGDFVLFSSNYKVNSAEQRDQRLAIAREQYEETPAHLRGDRPVEDDFGTLATHRFAAYERAVEVLREVAAAPGPTIVVRPHPAEDPRRWRDALAGIDRIRVVYEGEIGPWLLAARGLLHTGCTTALQAVAYGAPCGYLAPVGYLPDTYRTLISYRVSHDLGDVDAARRFVEEAVAGSLDGAPVALDDGELGPSDGRAAERIVAHLARLDVTHEDPVWFPMRVRARRQIARAVDTWRWSPFAFGRWRKRFQGTNAQRKNPGGYRRRESTRVLRELGFDDLIVRDEWMEMVRIERPAARSTH